VATTTQNMNYKAANVLV